MNDDALGDTASAEYTAPGHTTSKYLTPVDIYSVVERVNASPMFGAAARFKWADSPSDAHRRALLIEGNRYQHLCNDTCRCPVDGLVLLYHAKTDEHACQDIDCLFAHGMKNHTWMPMISRQGVRARYRAALLDAMASQPLGRHPDVAQQHVYVAAFRAIGFTMAAPVDDLGTVVRLDTPGEV